MALVERGEFHLTMIDDAGLVGRLAKELSDVAHEYQLTWPEFKRDPFGFTKRSFQGYGQMAGKFFGNRNVMLGLIVAVVAMAALVGIIGLLDRAQPGGIRRTGFIIFGLLTGIILAGVFAIWVQSQSEWCGFGRSRRVSQQCRAGNGRRVFVLPFPDRRQSSYQLLAKTA